MPVRRQVGLRREDLVSGLEVVQVEVEQLTMDMGTVTRERMRMEAEVLQGAGSCRAWMVSAQQPRMPLGMVEELGQVGAAALPHHPRQVEEWEEAEEEEGLPGEESSTATAVGALSGINAK